MKSTIVNSRRLLAGVAVVAVLPGAALAQENSAGASTGGKDAEIVVTGTLIRGAAPVGSNVIALGEQKIEEVAPISTNSLLAALPQVSNYFNKVPTADLANAVNQMQIVRPNIRNISPNNASSSATLIMVDGHRIASVGISQASIDPDVVPTGAIERVEVVTEGGSATYGADAVAGVINFVTRKRFDGVKVDAHYGIASKYYQWDASATLGKDWGSGSAWLSYTYTKSDILRGIDRDYIRRLDYTAQPYVGASHLCDQPNINISTNLPAAFGGGLTSQKTYAYTPGATSATLVANTANHCDATDYATAVPAVQRHGVMAGLFQELDDRTTFTARAFFSRRSSLGTSPMTGSVTMSPSNPYAIGPAGAVLGPGATCSASIPFPICINSETVDFSFAPLLGQSASRQTTLTREWGVNGELSRQIGETWQVRGLVNWSGSRSAFELTQPNVTRLNAAGAATTAAAAINPFNLSQTSPSVISSIIDNEIAGEAKDNLLDLRLIADGSLLALPGGDVRLALGAEYMRDEYAQRYQVDIRIGSLGGSPFTNYSRTVKSLFGELNVPVLGGGRGPSLVLSASGRYDDYSDFGHTFNPKFGATFKPVDWLSLRGNWGSSFTAPTPLDQLGSLQNTIAAYPFVAFTKPGDTPAPGSYTVAVQGSAPNLKPQKAHTWSLGFDMSPPVVPGLTVSFSYYNVDFKDILSTPLVNSQIFTNFGAQITTNVAGLTAAQLNNFATLAANGPAVITPLIGTRTVYEFVDFRTNNFGSLKVAGLDMSARYRHDTGFGGFDLAANANYQLKREQQATPTAAVSDLLVKDNGGRLQLQTIAGIDIGALRAQATWNHSAGYDISATNSVPVQTHIGSFDVFNLFFKLAVKSDSKILNDVNLTLNIDNVFDKAPPISFLTGPADSGYANGFTLGRMFVMGISKKF